VIVIDDSASRARMLYDVTIKNEDCRPNFCGR